MRALARAASLLRHAAVSAPTTGALHHPPLGVGSCLAKNLPGFFFNGYSTLLAPQSEVLIPPELLSSRTVWTPDRELGQYEDLVARVTNFHNEDKGFMVLDGDVFDVPIRKDIVHWVVRWQLAKRQQGTHSTKTISEVSGTGRKCYKQKGTGRARHGTLCGPNSVVVQPCMDLNHEAMQSSCRRKYGGWGLRLPCLLVLQRGSSWSLRTWKSLATRQKTLCNTLARWMIQRRFCWWMEATLIRS